MNLFRISCQKLLPIDETSFGLEAELQKVTEANLKAVFGLEFVASEYNLEDYYLDTLAFNTETEAFEIIEFKKKQDLSIMDQGQTYLNLVLDHKEKVLLEYNELKNKNYRLKDINWGFTRVKFIAPSFTRFQRRALNPKSPFELWEAKKYGNDILGYEYVQPITISRKGQQTPSLTGKAGKEIIVTTPEDIIVKMPSALKDAWRIIEEYVLLLGSDIEESSGESSISYKTKKKTFLQIWLVRDHLTVNFPYGNILKDDKNLLKGRGKTGRYITISSAEKAAEIEDYINQAYQNSLQIRQP